ncbi:polyprenyl synthetase family protein, partial [Paenibacillus graminis]
MSPFDPKQETEPAGTSLRQPLNEYIAEISSLVMSELEAALPGDWSVPGNLKDAMNYSLQAGGKRLRPLLVIAACEALGG